MTIHLPSIQSYLQSQALDGWLLYGFREQNPIAQSIVKLHAPATRRWFLWIPAQGSPRRLVHAIETAIFDDLPEALRGEQTSYVGWREIPGALAQLVGASAPLVGASAPLVGASARRMRIAMEYSPNNDVPFISRVDGGMLELVRESLNAEIVSSADLAQLALAVLSERQLASHRRAAEACYQIVEAAFALVAARLSEGTPITEYEVGRFIGEEFARREMTHEGPIVAVNANAANPHYEASAQQSSPIRVGDMLLIDLWGRETRHADDCYADITWTAYCGRDVPPRAKEIFEIVTAGRDRAVHFVQEKLKRGETVFGYEVDDACRQVIAEAGYGEAFFHRTGHSLGVTDHYLGVNIDNLETQDRRALLPGVMFTIEPGIYLPHDDFDGSATPNGRPKGIGIRSEVNCFMHADRLEITTLPIQRELRGLLA